MESTTLLSLRESTTSQSTTFAQLRAYPGYEITTSAPFRVRRNGCDHFLTEFRNNAGYTVINIHSNPVFLHRVIAQQFIDNPDPEHLVEIDHIDHIRDHNTIENLRWVTKEENLRNRARWTCDPIEWFDDEPLDNMMEIRFYNGFQFSNYFFDGERVITPARGSRHNYRVVGINKNNGISMRDINGRLHNFGCVKFFRTMNGLT